MDFVKALDISASGLKAQSTHLGAEAENIANADSTTRRGYEANMKEIQVSRAMLQRSIDILR